MRLESSRVHSLAEPFDCSRNASPAVRDAQRIKTHLDDTEYAKHHRSIDMAHVGDAERLALHLSKPRPEYNAAFGAAVILQWERIATIGHKDGRYRIGTLVRFRNIEIQCLSFLPYRNGTADCLGQQTVTKEDIVKLLFEYHVEGLAQREQEVFRRCASVFLIVRVPIAHGPVPIGCSQSSLLVRLAGAISGGHEAETGRRHQPFLR